MAAGSIACAKDGALVRYGGRSLPPVILARHLGAQLLLDAGPGNASDTRPLALDALGQLRPYFANCRQLAAFNPPD